MTPFAAGQASLITLSPLFHANAAKRSTALKQAQAENLGSQPDASQRDQ